MTNAAPSRCDEIPSYYAVRGDFLLKIGLDYIICKEIYIKYIDKFRGWV